MRFLLVFIHVLMFVVTICNASNCTAICERRASHSLFNDTLSTCECIDCFSNFTGFNCSACSPGFYEPFPTVCVWDDRACSVDVDCSSNAKSVGGRYNGTRHNCSCECANQWSGSNCSICPDRFDRHQQRNDTVNSTCSACRAGFDALTYPACYRLCNASDCGIGTSAVEGNVHTGCRCQCRAGFSGSFCNHTETASLSSSASVTTATISHSASVSKWVCPTTIVECAGERAAIKGVINAPSSNFLSDVGPSNCQCKCLGGWQGAVCQFCNSSKYVENYSAQQCDTCTNGALAFPICAQIRQLAVNMTLYTGAPGMSPESSIELLRRLRETLLLFDIGADLEYTLSGRVPPQKSVSNSTPLPVPLEARCVDFAGSTISVVPVFSREYPIDHSQSRANGYVQNYQQSFVATFVVSVVGRGLPFANGQSSSVSSIESSLRCIRRYFQDTRWTLPAAILQDNVVRPSPDAIQFVNRAALRTAASTVSMYHASSYLSVYEIRTSDVSSQSDNKLDCGCPFPESMCGTRKPTTGDGIRFSTLIAFNQDQIDKNSIQFNANQLASLERTLSLSGFISMAHRSYTDYGGAVPIDLSERVERSMAAMIKSHSLLFCLPIVPDTPPAGPEASKLLYWVVPVSILGAIILIGVVYWGCVVMPHRFFEKSFVLGRPQHAAPSRTVEMEELCQAFSAADFQLGSPHQCLDDSISPIVVQGGRADRSPSKVNSMGSVNVKKITGDARFDNENNEADYFKKRFC